MKRWFLWKGHAIWQYDDATKTAAWYTLDGVFDGESGLDIGLWLPEEEIDVPHWADPAQQLPEGF